MKTLIRVSALALTFGFSALVIPNSFAQSADHDDHSGHDDGAHTKMTPIPAADAPLGTYSEVAEDHVIGAADAPVTLILFASVTCGHCAAWFKDDYPVIKRDYIDTGKVRLVFREFPTGPVQVAVAGFLIADCGPEDRYMDSITYQMANQVQTYEGLQAGRVKETLESLGEQAGLTSEQTQACLTDEAGYKALNATVARGRAAGVQSVPSLMLNGVLYPSKDTSAAALSTAIDAAIAG